MVRAISSTKPLPVEEIKILLNDENNVDYRGIQARKIEHVRFKDLFQSELASDSILNNILGPIAIYDVYCDNVELLQVNDKYCLLVGQDPVDLAENVQGHGGNTPGRQEKIAEYFPAVFPETGLKVQRELCAAEEKTVSIYG